MSIIGSYIAVSETVARSFIYRQSSISDYIMAHDDADNCIDIDKAWHAIYYLLTSSAHPEEDTGAAAKAVPLGSGIEIEDDFGYGPPRLLTSDEVKEIDALIKSINSADLRKRFELNEMINAEIYPLGGFEENPDEFFDYVYGKFVQLQGFYRSAAEKDMTVIFYLD